MKPVHFLQIASRTAVERLFKQAVLLLSKAYERLSQRCLVVPTETSWGDRLYVALPESASTQIWLEGGMDQDLTQTLVALLKPGQTFVDVGAHLGYFALLARSRVGPSGRVIAFEPTPDTFALLRRNACYANMQTYPLALWSEKTHLAFNLYGQRFSAYNSFFAPRVPPVYQRRLRHRVVDVAAVSLDEFAHSHGVVPDVIKIDAESAEWRILEGAAHVLRAHRPVVIVEVGDLDIPGVMSSTQLVAILREMYDYTPFEWHDGRLIPHQAHERYDAGNLVFIPDHLPQ